MKLIIAGGGTGGHLFPALAVAEEFTGRDAATEIVFVGAERGLEKEVVPAKGYKLVLLDVEGFKKRTGSEKLRALYKAAKAMIKARRIIKDIGPDGVIGSGSYSSGPVVLAARLMGVKTAILEQNVVPGLTNRILGKLVDRVYTSFPEASKYFPAGKTVLAGNPIRGGIKEAHSERVLKEGAKFNILVFGGSQGATAINAAFLDASEYLVDIWNDLGVVHQTGEKGYGLAKDSYDRKGLKVDLEKFIDDMAAVYATADLVVCRSGATTIAEITALGTASILIPYPFSTDGHQEANARHLTDRGAAVMINQDELTGATLARTIRGFYEDREKLDRVRRAVKELGMPEAAGTIVDDYTKLITGGGAKAA